MRYDDPWSNVFHEASCLLLLLLGLENGAPGLLLPEPGLGK
jgi:hypothetical protein